jgi:hypothetical protein
MESTTVEANQQEDIIAADLIHAATEEPQDTNFGAEEEAH